MDIYYSEACERNKEPILQILKKYIQITDRRVLEIGAGTGQHAVYYAPHFPFLEWYPTELAKNIYNLKANLGKAGIANIKLATTCDVAKDDFPKLKFEVVYTANTFHIMPWKTAKTFMKLLGTRLRKDARAIIYGPFKYDGKFTSESNEIFDNELKSQDASFGIRAFEDVNKVMLKNGFKLLQDIEMPAHNHLLIYQRLEFISKKQQSTF